MSPIAMVLESGLSPKATQATTQKHSSSLANEKEFVLTGYLRKRNTKRSSKLLRNWDKRWFALDDTAFLYACSPKDTEPRQAFPLQDILEVKMVNEEDLNPAGLPGKKSHYEFEVWLPSRTLRLRPKSESQRRHWVSALQRARAVAKLGGARGARGGEAGPGPGTTRAGASAPSRDLNQSSPASHIEDSAWSAYLPQGYIQNKQVGFHTMGNIDLNSKISNPLITSELGSKLSSTGNPIPPSPSRNSGIEAFRAACVKEFGVSNPSTSPRVCGGGVSVEEPQKAGAPDSLVVSKQQQVMPQMTHAARQLIQKPDRAPPSGRRCSLPTASADADDAVEAYLPTQSISYTKDVARMVKQVRSPYKAKQPYRGSKKHGLTLDTWNERDEGKLSGSWTTEDFTEVAKTWAEQGDRKALGVLREGNVSDGNVSKPSTAAPSTANSPRSHLSRNLEVPQEHVPLPTSATSPAATPHSDHTTTKSPQSDGSARQWSDWDSVDEASNPTSNPTSPASNRGPGFASSHGNSGMVPNPHTQARQTKGIRSPVKLRVNSLFEPNECDQDSKDISPGHVTLNAHVVLPDNNWLEDNWDSD